ncbi:MAG: type II toxin-antitoxin system HicB family antitoxin [Proteobacteria bacterium]|nr:type II toxin-antitoxin system HicB family antitoxin [Pseudomonadota bacterium]
MKFFNFEIVIEKEEKDEGYFAYSPSLPGCFSNGKTIEETKKTFAKPFSNISCPCGSTHSQYHRKNALCMLKSFQSAWYNGSLSANNQRATHTISKITGIHRGSAIR